MGTGGCLSSFNNPTTASGTMVVNYSGSSQRYGQYLLQYTDYNSNADADG
jgi:hypothetical protein